MICRLSTPAGVFTFINHLNCQKVSLFGSLSTNSVSLLLWAGEPPDKLTWVFWVLIQHFTTNFKFLWLWSAFCYRVCCSWWFKKMLIGKISEIWLNNPSLATFIQTEEERQLTDRRLWHSMACQLSECVQSRLELTVKWAGDRCDTELSKHLRDLAFCSPVGRRWPLAASTWIPPGRDSETLVWTEECCRWSLEDDTNPGCWLWCN